MRHTSTSHKLVTKNKKKLTGATEERALTMIRAGFKSREICATMGIAATDLWQLAAKKRVKLTSEHPLKSIPESVMRKIAEDEKTGEAMVSIARRYGVSSSTVRKASELYGTRQRSENGTTAQAKRVTINGRSYRMPDSRPEGTTQVGKCPDCGGVAWLYPNGLCAYCDKGASYVDDEPSEDRSDRGAQYMPSLKTIHSEMARFRKLREEATRDYVTEQEEEESLEYQDEVA